MPISLFVETFEGLGVTADVGVPSTAPPATPIALVSVAPYVPISVLPTAPIIAGPCEFPFPLSHSLFLLCKSVLFQTTASHFMPCAFLIGPLPTVPSQFEVGSNSTTISDLMSEAAAFFTRFDQPEVNDLGPAEFWGSGPLFVDFHGFRVAEDCVSHLATIYSSRGDFMQGFRLSRSPREHFLRMLRSIMNDIEHNFVDTVSTERILQWRAAIQELISVGFAMEFVLDHLCEVARAFFIKRVQPTVDVINAQIEILKKEVADLEDCRERLLSSIGGPSCFGDQTLISRLR